VSKRALPEPVDVDEWLDECINPDGTRIVEGSTERWWVSWTSAEPETITLDGAFTLPELRKLVVILETAPGKVP
jgi:hypothetical protein